MVPVDLAARSGSSFPVPEPGDPAVIMYTSGTTSHPKGVPITYRNFYWKTIAHVAEFGISRRDRTAMVGPMGACLT